MTVHTRPHDRCDGPAQPRRVCRRLWRRASADTGAVSVEMAVLVLPLAAIMAVFAIFCARLSAVRLDLNATASAAARAASMARTPQAAHEAATKVAQANLASHHHTCSPLQVSVNTSSFVRGGQVAVTITCTMSTAGLTGLGLPGTLTGSSTAHAIIDTYRNVSLGFANSEALSGENRSGGAA